MRRALALALLLSATAARAQAPSDWYDAFRGLEAFVVSDSTWVATDGAAAGDAPPLFHARHLLMVFRADGDDPRGWPRRNVLLVEFPNGDRWAAETAFVVPGGRPIPFTRLSSGARTVEAWSLGGDPNDHEADFETRNDPSPCAGTRFLAKGGGREMTWHQADVRTRTVKASSAELRAASFTPRELEELAILRRLRAPATMDAERLLQGRIALVPITLDGDAQSLTIDLVPDPAPSTGELDAWGALAWIPAPLSPMDLPEGL